MQTKHEFIDNQIAGLNAILNVLYVLLALSIIVSLFGIVNTLVLTVFERTRELGHAARGRDDAPPDAADDPLRERDHGAASAACSGSSLGIVLGALLVARVDSIAFSLPVVQVVIFAILTIVVGILAAIFPARRAARLNVLEALQYE